MKQKQVRTDILLALMFLSIFCVALQATPVAVTADDVVNGGFESPASISPQPSAHVPLCNGFWCWHGEGTGTVQVVTSPVHSGHYAAQTSTTANGGGAYIFQDIQGAPTCFEWTFYVLRTSGTTQAVLVNSWDRSAGNGIPVVVISFNDTGTDFYVQDVYEHVNFVLSTGVWHQVTVASNCSSNTASLQLLVDGIFVAEASSSLAPVAPQTLILGDTAGAGWGGLATYDDVSLVAVVPACVPPPPGLVSWWRGEGNADDHMSANNGILSPTGTTFVAGEVGQAFNFGGPPCGVTIPDSPSLNPGQVTIEAWVRPDFTRPVSGSEVDTIFTKVDGALYGYALYILQGPYFGSTRGTLSFEGRAQTGPAGGQFPLGYFTLRNSPPIPNDGQYHHVAATYDGSLARVYLDGNIVDQSTSYSGPIQASAVSATIGVVWYVPLRYSSGAMDEVSLYNSALSESEIKAIFNAGAAGKCHMSRPLLGDINNDGVIDISDVILELRMALALDTVKSCSDINSDQSIDISDVILTLRMALALDPTRPCGG
jgi:Concanavalin A-like lectin/glucanases superfamily